jgi:hypothetical protein
MRKAVSASGGARTHNLRLRRPTLYPVELRTRIARIVNLLLVGVKQWKEAIEGLTCELLLGRAKHRLSPDNVPVPARTEARRSRTLALPVAVPLTNALTTKRRSRNLFSPLACETDHLGI